MNTLPIDQAKITTISAGESYAANDQSGQQARNKEGKTLWFVPVLLTATNTRPEMVRVKIAADTCPKFQPGTALRFGELQAVVWEMNGKHGISYRAERVEAARS